MRIPVAKQDKTYEANFLLHDEANCFSQKSMKTEEK